MKVAANGLQIEVDIQGPPNGEPLLLVMGLGMQLTGWPEPLVADLARRGYRVVRFDNRDIGLSQGFDAAGVPPVWRAALRYTFHLPVRSAPYTLADMAEDTLGVLDALGIAQAHVCGASMGGMIAQHLAVRHPQRLKSLTLLMTTSGARHLPQPRSKVQMAMLGRPTGTDEESLVAFMKRVVTLIGSPGYPNPPDYLDERLRAMVRRAWHPDGTLRQLLAVVADGDRSPMLGRIRTPTLVLHGQDDPLVPVAAAHDLAAKIRDARSEIIPGMGHDLPLGLLPRLAAEIASHAEAFGGSATAAPR